MKASGVFASIFIFIQRIFLLALYPYKTMRRISEDRDKVQLIVMWVIIAGYFIWANQMREYPYEPFILYLMTVFHFIATVIFFFMASQIFKKEGVTVSSFLFTFSYALMPTLIWFVFNSTLFAILPPPRSFSALGKAFSIFFIGFSIAMLLWKIILQYLAIRFSTKMNFFQIMYSMIIYLVMIIPYALYLYSLQFFRIPFL